MNVNKVFTYNDLPRELKEVIFSCLDVTTLMKMRLVSKESKELMGKPLTYLKSKQRAKKSLNEMGRLWQGAKQLIAQREKEVVQSIGDKEDDDDFRDGVYSNLFGNALKEIDVILDKVKTIVCNGELFVNDYLYNNWYVLGGVCKEESFPLESSYSLDNPKVAVITAIDNCIHVFDKWRGKMEYCLNRMNENPYRYNDLIYYRHLSIVGAWFLYATFMKADRMKMFLKNNQKSLLEYKKTVIFNAYETVVECLGKDSKEAVKLGNQWNEYEKMFITTEDGYWRLAPEVVKEEAKKVDEKVENAVEMEVEMEEGESLDEEFNMELEQQVIEDEVGCKQVSEEYEDKEVAEELWQVEEMEVEMEEGESLEEEFNMELEQQEIRNEVGMEGTEVNEEVEETGWFVYYWEGLVALLGWIVEEIEWDIEKGFVVGW